MKRKDILQGTVNGMTDTPQGTVISVISADKTHVFTKLVDKETSRTIKVGERIMLTKTVERRIPAGETS